MRNQLLTNSYTRNMSIVDYKEVVQEKIDVNEFRENLNSYTIIDVRNISETAEKKILIIASQFQWVS